MRGHQSALQVLINYISQHPCEVFVAVLQTRDGGKNKDVTRPGQPRPGPLPHVPPAWPREEGCVGARRCPALPGPRLSWRIPESLAARSQSLRLLPTAGSLWALVGKRQSSLWAHWPAGGHAGIGHLGWHQGWGAAGWRPWLMAAPRRAAAPASPVENKEAKKLPPPRSCSEEAAWQRHSSTGRAPQHFIAP